jgi:hypothetical protein
MKIRNPFLRKLASLAASIGATMSTAQSLIEAGYARSVANDAGKLASDGELLLHLNRKYQSLYAIMALAGGDNALAKTVLVFGGVPASAVLPVDLIDIKRIERPDGSKVYLIPADEKDRSWHLAPAVYRQGGSLISRGNTGDLVAAESVNVFHLDAPAALSALVSVTDARFPVRYEDILVLDLAIYLSTKDEGRSETEYKQLKDEYADAMAMFNALVRGSNTALERPSTATAATKSP